MERSCFMLLVCIGLSACSSSSTDIDSTEVVTQRIWAGVEIEARGNGNTRVKVELNQNRSSGSNIRLTANERLEASAAGVTVTLQEDLDLSDIDYEGTLPVDAGGTQVRITLFRADGSIVNGSTASLPEPFFIATPARRQRVTAGDSLLIAWSPGSAGNEIRLGISTICPVAGGGSSISVQSFEIDDSGSHLFDTAMLNAASAPDLAAGTRCEMDVTLRRGRNGTIDPAFRGGGHIRATQERTVENLRLRL